jgi:hypothetical protein
VRSWLGATRGCLFSVTGPNHQPIDFSSACSYGLAT